MIQVTQDPTDSNKVILSSTVTLFLDKLALSALSDEIERAIRAQAVKDLEGNEEVKKIIAAAATNKLLSMLK